MLNLNLTYYSKNYDRHFLYDVYQINADRWRGERRETGEEGEGERRERGEKGGWRYEGGGLEREEGAAGRVLEYKKRTYDFMEYKNIHIHKYVHTFDD